MNDRAHFIRDSMRQSWGQRYRHYLENAAPHSAQYAELLIRSVRPRPGERVLDVATGPGVVALKAGAAVGPSGSVLATDLTPEWGEVIAERCAEEGLANVTFRAMSAAPCGRAGGSGSWSGVRPTRCRSSWPRGWWGRSRRRHHRRSACPRRSSWASPA